MSETERADSAKHLWADFRFVLKKMGFCRAELKLGEQTRSFYVPNTPHDSLEQLWTATHRTHGEVEVVLTLYAEKAHFTQSQFGLTADIATEALVKVRAKWKDLYGESLDFDAVAHDLADYRMHRARQLYRPTY